MAGGRRRSLWWCCCFDILVHLIESIAGGGGGGGGGKSSFCGSVEDLVLVRGEDVSNEDLLFEILARLPVKSLVRFKTVSKSWCEVIQRPDFIDHHISSFGSSNKFGSFILQCIGKGKSTPNFLYLTGDGDNNELPVFENLGYVGPGLISMVGSCNGVVCIHDAIARNIILWNPAILETMVLPESLPLPYGYKVGLVSTDFVAFGFDIENKDYKVLQVTSWTPKEMLPRLKEDNDFPLAEFRYPKYAVRRAQVFSLRDDSWRYIKDADLPFHCYQAFDMTPSDGRYYIERNQGRYLNGKYYFMGRHWPKITTSGWRRKISFEWVILSFDFTKECFTTIKPPLACDISKRSDLSDLSLDLIGGKIALLARPPNYDKLCVVWVLNDYNMKNEESSSWTYLYTVRLPVKGHTQLLAFPKNGKIGLCMGKLNHFYNCVTSGKEECQIKNKKCEFGTMLWRADVYKPSLVPVITGDLKLMIEKEKIGWYPGHDY